MEPPHWTAKTRHARVGAPSTSTVQAPQTPCSHPRCVPCRPKSSRNTSAKVRRGSTSNWWLRPFTARVTDVTMLPRARRPGPGVSAPRRGAACSPRSRAHPRWGRHPRPPRATAARASGVGCCPTRRDSARFALTGVEAAPASASLMSTTTPASPTEQVATVATVAKSPAVWLFSRKPIPASWSNGRRTSVMISSAASAVVKSPSKNSLAGIRRVPRVLRATMIASSAAASMHHSAAGSACARLPAKVPRTLIGRWPTRCDTRREQERRGVS